MVQVVGVIPPLPVQIEDGDEKYDNNSVCIAAMMVLNDPQYTECTEKLYQTDIMQRIYGVD